MTKRGVMRILLQQIRSGRFLANDGSWTDHENEAKEFKHFLEALVFARGHVDGSVGAYCVFADPSYNFSIYLRNASVAMEWEKKLQTWKHREEQPVFQGPGGVAGSDVRF